MNLMRSLVLLCALCGSCYALATTFPNRPLTLMIGFDPGGSTDVQAQVLATILTENLGQPVNVLHQPGAGGAVAAAMLANSPEQGYVMMFSSSHPFTFTPLASSTSYDTTDFRFINSLAIQQSVLVSGGVMPYSDWAGFLAYARQRPEVTFASQTPQDRFVVRLIAQKEDLNIRFVPTSGGSGSSPLVLSGDVDFAYSGGSHTAYTDDGQMNVLMALSTNRLEGYPDVPAIRELGYAFSDDILRVVAVPSNTPDEQVTILAQALERAAQDPRFQAVSQRLRLPIAVYGEAELGDIFLEQVEGYRHLIQAFGE